MCCDGAVRLASRRDPAARDIQLAAGAFVLGAVMLALGGYAGLPATIPVSRWVFLIPLAVLCVALGLRRVAPLTGLGIGVVAVTGDVLLGASLANVLVFSQVLYDMCVHGPAWLWRWALRISIALTALGAGAGVVVTGSWRGAAVGIPFALVLVLSVVSAISVRQYRDQAAAERARAEQTARLSELDRQQAVAAERTRMARELHDLVANHLSAVAIHATALLSVPDLDRAASRQALQVIRASSVQGLAEMREMVNLLRDPAAPDQGAVEPPGVATLRQGYASNRGQAVRLADAERLFDVVRRAGLAVTVSVAGPEQPLPVDVDLAAYRILQESLTNALKHGDGRVEVSIGYEPRTVRLRVTNSISASGSPVPGSGSGLTGMRERAELLGGRLSAQRCGDTWQVRAQLPTPIGSTVASWRGSASS